MTRDVLKELEAAGYKFIRRGKHDIYQNDAGHRITISVSPSDKQQVHIIRGLIRRGRRQQASRQASQ